MCLLVLSKPFAFETPLSFDSNRSATHGWYVTIDDANENLMSFLAIFKLCHVCFCNRFTNTQIFNTKIIYNSPVIDSELKKL
jgi:hypothetical protein